MEPQIVAVVVLAHVPIHVVAVTIAVAVIAKVDVVVVAEVFAAMVAKVVAVIVVGTKDIKWNCHIFPVFLEGQFYRLLSSYQIDKDLAQIRRFFYDETCI